MSVKLRYYWMPNLIGGFHVTVKSLVEAYICDQLFTSLDLVDSKKIYNQLLCDFGEQMPFIERQTNLYKAFRRQHSINSPHCIEMNTGGLSILVGEDWENWVDESEKHDTQYSFEEFVDYLKEEHSEDWKKELAEYELKNLKV